MSQNQGDFTPVVKGGYKADDAFHRRNWRHLSDFLRSNFVTNERLADGSVDRFKVEDGEITNAKIETLSVDKLTAGDLTADVVMTGKLVTSLDESVQRVEITSAGIRLTDGTEDTVLIPVTGEATFRGGLDASSLTSQGATLRGSTVVDSLGSLSFASGVADPSAAPSMSWTYTKDSLGTTVGSVRGGDRSGNYLYLCSPTNDAVETFLTTTGVRQNIKDTTNMGGTLAGVNAKPYGVTIVGTDAFVVFTTSDLPGSFGVAKFALSSSILTGGADDDVMFLGTNFDYLAGICTDGTDLFVFWVNTSGDLKRTPFTTGLVSGTTVTVESAQFTGSKVAYDVTHEDTASSRWWVSWKNASGAYGVRVYNSSDARVASQDFDQPDNTRVIYYNGTAARFESVPYSADYIRIHTAWVSSSSYVHAKYAWYANTGGYETLASAQSYLAMVRRANLRLTVSGMPSGADRTRFYLLEDNVVTNPSAGAMWLQSTETGMVVTYSSYTGSGTADNTTNDFPASTPGSLTLPKEPGAWPSTPAEAQFWYDTDADVPRVRSTGTTDLIVVSMMAFSGFTWKNLTTGLTDEAPWRVYGDTAAGVDTAKQGVVLPWDGTVLGIATLAVGNKTAGTASFQVFKNGSALSSDVSWADSTKVTTATWAPGTYTFAAGDELDIRATTNGSFAPTTLEVEAFLYVARTA